MGEPKRSNCEQFPHVRDSITTWKNMYSMIIFIISDVLSHLIFVIIAHTNKI